MTKFRELIDAEQTRDIARRHEHGWQGRRELPGGAFTIGDLASAVLAIDDPETARDFYRGYLSYLINLPDAVPDRNVADIAKANIGWCFGEGMTDERRAMWREACGATHPVFGAMVTRPSPEDASACSVAFAMTSRGDKGARATCWSSIVAICWLLMLCSFLWLRASYSLPGSVRRSLDDDRRCRQRGLGSLCGGRLRFSTRPLWDVRRRC